MSKNHVVKNFIFFLQFIALMQTHSIQPISIEFNFSSKLL